MEKVLLGILITLCIAICWQDLRQRAVHWILFPMLFGFSIWFKWQYNSFEYWLYNAMILTFLMGALTLYLTFKHGKLINITKGYFSWGDILFLIAVIPLFETFSYIFYFTVGTLVALLIHVFAHVIKPQRTVPYAGYMGMVTIAYLFLETRLTELISQNF